MSGNQVQGREESNGLGTPTRNEGMVDFLRIPGTVQVKTYLIKT